MVAEKQNRVIVILGMHRGGTSLIARALNLLGVELGEDLLPPAPDNPTGFWESRTILGVNEALLAALGMTWDSVLPINPCDWELPRIKELQLDALEKLRGKFAESRLWGFKDPRTARLLPFWKTIFQHLNVAESYVLIIRNPLSVAKSLSSLNRLNPYPLAYRRVGFSPRKAYILWLEHMLSAFAYTEGKRRVVVDYDQLLASPSTQLRRLVDRLSLPSNNRSDSAIEEFETRFLDPNLRHDRFESQDIQLDSNAQAIVANAYEFFRSCARDEALEGNPSQTFDAIRSWLEGAAPFLTLAGDLDRELVTVCENFMKAQQESEELSTCIQASNELRDRLERQVEEAFEERVKIDEKLALASAQLQTLSEEAASLKWKLNFADQQLHEIVASPGWQTIQRYRGWVAKRRRTHPRLFRRYESLALRILRRTAGRLDRQSSLAHAVAPGHQPHVGLNQSSEAVKELNLQAEENSRQEISKSLLIVSGCPGDAYRYRAVHQAEELQLLGLTVDTALFDAVDYDRVLRQYSAFVLHRVPHTAGIEDFIKRAKTSEKPVIFDTDDLVFNEKFVGDIEAIRDCPPDQYNLHLDGIRRYYRTLSLCHAALVSTEDLRDRIKELFPEMPVYVNRNAVSNEMIRQADSALADVSKAEDGFVRVIYMSGTRTHNGDFIQCSAALERLLHAYPQVRLMVVGHLDLPERFRSLADRLEVTSLIPWQDLPRLMRRADINLAPLELENAFTHCKSELKYFEAGLLELPTVASQVPAFQNAITQGKNGFLCRSEQDWFDSLEQLVLSTELRRLIGSRAREDVLARYTTRSRAPELTKAIRQIFNDLRITRPRPLSISFVTQAPIAQTGGGYKNIFMMANGLSARGHDVHIYVEPIAHLAGLTDAKIIAFCHKHFGRSTARIHVGHEQILPSDIALATAYPTAYVVNNLTNAKCKAYFIQDFEPDFFNGSEPRYEQAERTYDLPLKKIALGKYLQTLFSKRDRVDVPQIPFALDLSIFRNLRNRPQLPIRVMFFARPSLKRRAYPIGVEALRILADACPEVEIVFYGMNESEDLGFNYQNLGELSREQVAHELNRSHIHLSFSLTNISWVPFEAMRCGCAVVEAKVPSVEMWMEEEVDSCVLVEPKPQAVGNALIKLVRNPQIRDCIAASGEKYVSTVSATWEEACDQLERILLGAVFEDSAPGWSALGTSHNGRPDKTKEDRNISDLRDSASEGRSVSKPDPAPVVIGALGGSGTRIIARIARDAGFFIGSNLNESEDSLDVAEFLDRWVNRYLRRALDPLTDKETNQMKTEFEDCLIRHRRQIANLGARWGLKEPRSIYLLPFFHARFPQMRFIHLVRDGRDMAFSSNQNQLAWHGEAVLEHNLFNAPRPVRSAALWNSINLAAASYGETYLGKHYLNLRFEDLCSQPASVIARVFSFLQASGNDFRSTIESIKPPETIGRWKRTDNQQLLEEISNQARIALERFSYI